MRKYISVCIVLALAGMAAFAADDDKPLTIYTTFYPLTYFTQAIGGPLVNVVNPLPDGEDGAFWVPPREVVKQYHAADLIIMNGTNYETGFGKVSLPESKVVVTTAFLKGNEVILEDSVTHSHGAAGTHTHQGMDGHTWVDPHNAKKQAQAICDALCEKRPAHAAEFKAGLDALNKRFDELDQLIQDKIVPLAKDRQLCASHPAYNYLARAYKLNVKSFHMDPNETPPKEELDRIAAFLKEHPSKIMLWEDAPKAENEKLMKEKFALTSVVFSPCEALDKEDAKAGRNYFDVMKRNIESLAAVLK
ncbi:MAG TPA: zinc ABC transporter substrate-binding protein [Planctomycetota bacterium]|nr:zinc ABC transporter substrate-binding protein [Planctomycetota bacterium]